MNDLGRLGRSCALAVLVVLVAACSSGGVAPASRAPSLAPSPSQSPSTSQGPDTPIGTDVPPNGGGDPGGIGGGDFIVPKPGQLEPRPVRIDKLTAAVDGRHVVITAAWTSGVEPCYVLDTVIVARGDKSFAITLREGHGPEQVMCIEIAQMKQTRIDLGELDPGTYAITDSQGAAPPIQVIVG
jgi:hypothetical protein